MFRKKKNIIKQLEIVNRPKSIVSEQFRTLRTNILFTSSDITIKKLMVTSSEPAEGKSTISANIAATFAQAGYKTLLIDADMRKPTQHKIFEQRNAIGLSNLITGRVEILNAIQVTNTENLSLLSAGPVPPNPAELLSSSAMTNLLHNFESSFEMIILDTPPVLAVTDSKVVANLVDGSLLVVNASKTHRDKVIDSKTQLEKSEANILGIVLNDVSPKEVGNQYYYYGDVEN